MFHPFPPGGHLCNSPLSWASSGFERQPLRGLPGCNAAVGEDRGVEALQLEAQLGLGGQRLKARPTASC